MQAVVGASAAPLGVPGVPVAPQGSVGQGLQGPAITTEALEDLGGGILAQESQGVHLEGGNIESPVDEDPGDSLRAGRSAERSLIGDEAKGFREQELQAQVLKKVGIIFVGDSGNSVPVEETTKERVGAASHLCRRHEARKTAAQGSTETHHPRLASQPPLSLTPWKPVAHHASLTLTKRLRMARPLGPLEAALRFP